MRRAHEAPASRDVVSEAEKQLDEELVVVDVARTRHTGHLSTRVLVVEHVLDLEEDLSRDLDDRAHGELLAVPRPGEGGNGAQVRVELAVADERLDAPEISVEEEPNGERPAVGALDVPAIAPQLGIVAADPLTLEPQAIVGAGILPDEVLRGQEVLSAEAEPLAPPVLDITVAGDRIPGHDVPQGERVLEKVDGE